MRALLTEPTGCDVTLWYDPKPPVKFDRTRMMGRPSGEEACDVWDDVARRARLPTLLRLKSAAGCPASDTSSGADSAR